MRKKLLLILLIFVIIFAQSVSGKTLEQYRKVGDSLVRIEGESNFTFPVPGISNVIYPETIPKGKIVHVSLEVNNTGAYAPNGFVILSHSPGLKLVNYSGYPTIYKPGDEIYDIDMLPIPAKYPIINWSEEFYTGDTKSFSANFTATSLDKQWFKVRLFFMGEGGLWSGKRIYPDQQQSKIKDQQKFPAFKYDVAVTSVTNPEVLLACFVQEFPDNRALITLNFRNVGTKPLMNPMYYWDGKALLAGWDLAPGATEQIIVRLANYTDGDIIPKKVRITGCYGDSCTRFYSKEYTVIFYITGYHVSYEVTYEEPEALSKDNIIEDNLSSISDLNLNLSENTSIFQNQTEKVTEKTAAQYIFDALSNFFRGIFVELVGL